MRLASFSVGGGPALPGVVDGEEIVDLSDAVTGLPATMRELLALGAAGLERAARRTGARRGSPRAGSRSAGWHPCPTPRPSSASA